MRHPFRTPKAGKTHSNGQGSQIAQIRRSDFADLPYLVLEDEAAEVQEPVVDYPAIADAYAKAVASGKIPRCRLMVQAAKRYLKMRELAEKPRNPYYFSDAHVVDYCSFIEKLVHVESGGWEIAQRKPDGTVDKHIILEPSQIWSETAIQGFRWREDDTRVVTRSLEIEPRKNGKTLRLMGAALFDLTCSNQMGPQICIAASTVQQLDKTIYGILLKELVANEDLVEQYKITWTGDEIRCRDGRIFKLSSRGEAQDGLNPSLAIFEEGHAGAASVYNVVRSAFGARPNGLLRMITTAGYRPEGPARDLMLEARQVLAGRDDPSFFAAIYELDEEDYLDPENKTINWNRLLNDEALVAKANPLYRISLQPRVIRDQLEEAKKQPMKRGEVARTRFNIWTGAGQSLIDETQWAACKAEIDITDFLDRKAFLAVDLAGYNDMCAVGAIFDVDERRIAGFVDYFIPEGSTLLTDPDLYDILMQWAEAGWLTITEGAEADYDRIEEHLLLMSQSFDVEGIAFDPYQSNQISKRCYDRGLPVYRYQNSAAMMTTPTDDLVGRISGRRFLHNGNGVLAWNAANVHAEKRDNGSIMPKKEAKGSKRKIDGFVTLVMANGLRLGVDAKEEKPEKKVIDPFLKRGGNLPGFQDQAHG